MKKSPWRIFNIGLFFVGAIVLLKNWNQQVLVFNELQQLAPPEIEALNSVDSSTQNNTSESLSEAELQRRIYDSLPEEVKRGMQELEKQQTRFPLERAEQNVTQILGDSPFAVAFIDYLSMRFSKAGQSEINPISNPPVMPADDFQKMQKYIGANPDSVSSLEVFELYYAGLNSEVEVAEKITLVETALESIAENTQNVNSLRSQILQAARVSQIPDEKLNHLYEKYQLKNPEVPAKLPIVEK